jgi:hypothetical protein
MEIEIAVCEVKVHPVNQPFEKHPSDFESLVNRCLTAGASPSGSLTLTSLPFGQLVPKLSS